MSQTESGSHGHWVPYGYEYNGQSPLFDASLACDRIAYGILTAVSSSGGICVLNQDARKNQLTLACLQLWSLGSKKPQGGVDICSLINHRPNIFFIGLDGKNQPNFTHFFIEEYKTSQNNFISNTL